MSSKMKANLEISLRLSNLGLNEYSNHRKTPHNDTLNEIYNANKI